MKEFEKAQIETDIDKYRITETKDSFSRRKWEPMTDTSARSNEKRTKKGKVYSATIRTEQ